MKTERKVNKTRKKIIRREPELSLQTDIVDMLRKKLKKKVLFTAFPAGGGGRVRGAKLKKAGLQAGWPDIQLIYQGYYYGLEVKTETGRLSPAQTDLHKRLTEDGCSVAVARSVSDALEIIVDWGLARKHKQNVESGSPTSTA
tara:strand:- start:277 stop:705 length:429 start_codon:yes stop_codon:yes gene_type:complete